MVQLSEKNAAFATFQLLGHMTPLVSTMVACTVIRKTLHAKLMLNLSTVQNIIMHRCNNHKPVGDVQGG